MNDIKKKIGIIILSLFVSSTNLSTKVENKIIAKVGTEIITAIDVQNEIRTILAINKKTLNQETINSTKNLAIKTLIGRTIKVNEIKKYNITYYSKEELDQVKINIAKKLGIEKKNTKNFFSSNNIDYDTFVDSQKTELLWKTLIYSMYKNQITINPVEVENELNLRLKSEVKKKKFNLSELTFKNVGIETQNLTKNIYQMIQENGFENAVKKFSISASKINNGNIGWVDEISLSANYLNELNKINKGEITRPIKSLESITILKVNDLQIVENKNLNEQEIKDFIIKNKKDEKLNLFSRSHFSNLENTILIIFL
jgi:parvulin-like peptidyl-prolyl isomerase